METPALGIIGGSGLYALAGLDELEFVDVQTPWGPPSEAIHVGRVDGVRVAFLSRHGSGHVLSPSEIPYAANVCAMKMLGVTNLVSVSAVGSLAEDIPPRSFVIPDQIIDRTLVRRRTFFDDGVVAHVGMAEPFCPGLACVLAQASTMGGLPVCIGGTYVCIEGPQFSTRAESHLYRSWGASVIGMTGMPEARLAREAEMCYACLAMVTDYDVWRESGEAVSVDAVLANLFSMTEAVQQIVISLVANAPDACQASCRSALSAAIITDPARVTLAVRERLAPIAGAYLRPSN